MARILLFIGALILVVGGLIAFLARINVVSVNKDLSNKVASTVQTDFVSGTKSSDNFGATEIPADPPLTKAELLNVLDASMSAVNKRIDDLATQQSNQGITPLPSPSIEPTQTVNTPKVVYIPVGFGGSGTAISDFADLHGQEITIDPSNYPGYKDMVFEVSARIYQGNGTGQIRLKNENTGTSILNSTVSTSSQDYSELISTGFTVASGKNTYIIQTKSSTGYSVDLQLSRIRVDY